MSEHGDQENEIDIETGVNLEELTSLISSAISTRMAVVIALPGIVGNESLVLRIQSEFVGLKATFLTAVGPDRAPAGVVPGPAMEMPAPVPLISPEVEMEIRINRELYNLRKENRVLNRKN